jgi:hypothetical protein
VRQRRGGLCCARSGRRYEDLRRRNRGMARRVRRVRRFSGEAAIGGVAASRSASRIASKRCVSRRGSSTDISGNLLRAERFSTVNSTIGVRICVRPRPARLAIAAPMRIRRPLRFASLHEAGISLGVGPTIPPAAEHLENEVLPRGARRSRMYSPLHREATRYLTECRNRAVR